MTATRARSGRPRRSGGRAGPYEHGYTYYPDGRLKTVAYPSDLTAVVSRLISLEAGDDFLH